ncbi:hypothetical protein EES42_40385 [Streptomyces sp. ADI95-17]|nr:hypothetical protein EES42_40385 [Streptomyces sp. ADI95-17]
MCVPWATLIRETRRCLPGLECRATNLISQRRGVPVFGIFKRILTVENTVVEGVRGDENERSVIVSVRSCPCRR